MSVVEAVSRAVSRNATRATPDLSPEADLLARGVLDSFGIVAVAADLEKELGCQFPAEEFLPENFRTILNIAGLVERLRRGVDAG